MYNQTPSQKVKKRTLDQLLVVVAMTTWLGCLLLKVGVFLVLVSVLESSGYLL